MAMAVFQQKKPTRIAVMGMPGHGKSTFLNLCLYKSDEGRASEDVLFFAVAASGASCTKEVSDKTVSYDGRRVTFVDTMGWPDPDKSQAADMYDAVVEHAINNPEGLNAVVWVVNNDRENEQTLMTYRAFMRELKQASCRILMLVNGREAIPASQKKRMSSDQLHELNRSKKAVMLENAHSILSAMNFEIQDNDVDTFISVDIDELEEGAVDWLLTASRHLPCKKSNVRSYTQMKNSNIDLASAIASHRQDALNYIDRCQNAVDAEIQNRAKSEALGGWGGGIGAAGATGYFAAGFFTGGWAWVAGGVSLVASAATAAAVSGSALADYFTDEQLHKAREELGEAKHNLDHGETKQRLEAEAAEIQKDILALQVYLEA